MLEYLFAMANMRRKTLIAVIGFLIAVVGCCKPFDSNTKREDEASREWVTRSWTGQFDWTRIGGWKGVEESRISRAETFLQATAVVRLTTAEAMELVGESNAPDGIRTPYLLRGIGDSKVAFPLELSVRPNGAVWVGGGANSKCPVAMRRRPVVAWLEKMPETVYVTFSVNRD